MMASRYHCGSLRSIIREALDGRRDEPPDGDGTDGGVEGDADGSAAEVEIAAAIRKLAEVRTSLKTQQVARRDLEQRRLRSEEGLRLSDMTDDFRSWLDSTGLVRSTVIKYRSR